MTKSVSTCVPYLSTILSADKFFKSSVNSLDKMLEISEYLFYSYIFVFLIASKLANEYLIRREYSDVKVLVILWLKHAIVC